MAELVLVPMTGAQVGIHTHGGAVAASIAHSSSRSAGKTNQSELLSLHFNLETHQ